jgi:putative drug exporter of the RND superfamily
MQRRGAALGVARWSARHPWRAMAGWLVFVLICLFAGSAAGTRQLADADTGSGQSGHADRVVANADYPTQITENILVQPRSGRADAEVSAAVTQLRTSLAGLDVVRQVKGADVSADGRTQLLPVVMQDGGLRNDAAVSWAADRVEQLQTVVATVGSQHPDLRVEEVGDASLEASLGRQVSHDFRQAGLLSLPLTLFILVITFGALIAAGVPVLLALSAVASAIGLSALTSHLFPNSDVISSVILLIGMAVGVDYSLFYLRREREERAAGRTSLDAVDIAAATSGRAVLVSGIAVMIAMSGMFFSGNKEFVSLGIGMILVVAVAVIGSITVLPAVLAKLGHRVDRPRVPFIHRLRSRDGSGRIWPSILRVVLAKPAVSLVVGVTAMLALAAPALGMHLRTTGPSDLPRSIPELRTYDRMVAAFPQEGTTHQVVVWGSQPLNRSVVDAAAHRLQVTAASDGRLFAPDTDAPDYSPDGKVAQFDVAVTYDQGDPRAREGLRVLRDTLVPQAFSSVPGVQTGVTGQIAEDADFSAAFKAHLPLVVGFVLLLTFLVLVLAFRSVVIAGTAIALNLLSVGASYGLLVLVFQHTWAEGLLGFHSNGAVISWLPLFLFVVLFGLSMDYHVFVVSRVREAMQRGLSTRDAVADGVTRSAGTVTSAAVVMVGVFGIFATLSLLDFKQLGIGLAVAVLLDATVVRAVLLPSAMTVLGRWNWWLPKSWERLPHLEGELPVGSVPPVPAPSHEAHVVQPVG